MCGQRSKAALEGGWAHERASGPDHALHGLRASSSHLLGEEDRQDRPSAAMGQGREKKAKKKPGKKTHKSH
jgi:hypothetical protein